MIVSGTQISIECLQNIDNETKKQRKLKGKNINSYLKNDPSKLLKWIYKILTKLLKRTNVQKKNNSCQSGKEKIIHRGTENHTSEQPTLTGLVTQI